MEADALVPLTLRLNRLEAQIRGDSFASAPDQKPTHVIRQMRIAQETLETVGHESDALKRLLAGCESGFLVYHPRCCRTSAREILVLNRLEVDSVTYDWVVLITGSSTPFYTLKTRTSWFSVSGGSKTAGAVVRAPSSPTL